MDPELKHLLDENLALAKENHRLLKSVRHHQLFETYGKWIFWIVVIFGSAYGAQVYLRPLVSSFIGPDSTISGPLGLPTSADIKKLIDSYKVGK